MSEKALFDENLTKEFGLAEIIRTRLMGVDPDEQDVNLDDEDWQLILDALEALQWYGENARLCRLIHSEGDSADGGKRAQAVLQRASASARPAR